MKLSGPCFRLSALLCVFFCALSLAGCSLTSATAIQYDSAAAPEKMCTLNISSTFTVRQFDGKTVGWKAGAGDMWAQVKIPEGAHSFVLDYTRSGQAGTMETYTGKNMLVSYDRFQAGRTYLLASNPTGAKTIMIGIKDVTNEPDWGSFSKAMNWTQGFEWLPIGKAE